MGWFPYCGFACYHSHKMKQLLLLFLLLVSDHIFAATTPAIAWYNLHGSQWSPSNAAEQYTSKEAACNKFADGLASNYTIEAKRVEGSICSVDIYNPNSGGRATFQNPIFTVYACPANTTNADGGTPNASTQCTIPACPSGLVWSTVTNSCNADCSKYTGQPASLSVNCSSTNAPSAVCMPNNCAANLTGSAVGFDKTKACWFGYAYGKYTGSTCSGEANSANYSNPTQAPVQPVDSPETDCLKAGKTFGSVNGVTVCVPKSSAGGNPTTTKDTSTSQTKDKDAEGNESEKSSNTEVTVKKDGDNVEVTTKTKNSDGTEKEETTTQTYDTFCAKNPNDKLCKKPSEDEGSDCEENPDLPACMKAGEASDTDVIGSETRTVSFNPVNITSGGSCPPDKSVSVAGRSMTFSYSWICQYASMFKPFMLAFAYLSAAMFLFSGFKGSQA